MFLWEKYKKFNSEMKVSVKDKDKLFVYFCELNKVLNNSWFFSNFNIRKVYPKFLVYTH